MAEITPLALVEPKVAVRQIPNYLPLESLRRVQKNITPNDTSRTASRDRASTRSLHTSFGTNIKGMSPDVRVLMDNIDINSRIIDSIRKELHDTHCNGIAHQLACADILDEIFANFSQAMYLYSVGLIVPARILVRTALELGVMSVYMWDMPHEYWGWARHHEDISFTKMNDHLSSARYATYLATLRGELRYNCGSLKVFYSSLSCTVHGGISELPLLSPERYRSTRNDIQKHLIFTVNVQNELIKLWTGRFVDLDAFIGEHFPQSVMRSRK